MSQPLEELVNDVIDLTGAAKPEMFEDDAPVLSTAALEEAEDQGFYLVGLIGGKEVGKSALVNALVGRTITKSTSYGEGTHIVTAYAHASQATHLRELLEREAPGRYAIVTHESPRLFRQVLLDLPDIDSHWQDHVEVTRRMLRHMLFPLWIQSVEKYADLQPQQLLSRVAAGNAAQNFLFCLNKADQLFEKEGPEAGREVRDDYARRMMRLLKLEAPPRVFMLSAIHPDRYDLPSLRDALGTQKTLADVEKGRDAASRQQEHSIFSWISQQNLPGRAQSLARLAQDAEELLNHRIGVPLLERCIPAMLDDPAHRLAILDDCLKVRCARWPFVNIIQGLAGPVAAMFRRRSSSRAAAENDSPEALVEAHVRPGGQDLAHLVRASFAQLQQSQPAVSSLYQKRKLWEDRQSDLSAEDLRRQLAETLGRQRSIVAARVAGAGGPISGLFRWALTVGALLWFPIAQPVAEAALQDHLTGGVKVVALAIVHALSVTFLLKALTFMILWFALIWLLVRWDTQRRVEKQLTRWKIADAADPGLSLPGRAVEWLTALQEPIQTARDRFEGLLRRAEELKPKAA